MRSVRNRDEFKGIEVLYITLGWLFGLLSPAIALRIERGYKRKSLKIVIKNELSNLSFRLAGSYYLIQTHLGNKDKSSVAWVKSIYEKHKEDCPRRILEGIDKLLETSEVQFEALQNIMKAKEGIGLGLKNFSLPFTESILENIEIFDSKFQKDILNVRDQIIMLNEEIKLSMEYFQRTFDTSTMDTNAEIIRNNIRKSYEVIQDRCKFIVDKIENFLKSN